MQEYEPCSTTDDYIMVGPPDSQLCHTRLKVLMGECTRLDVPIASHKTEGPATEVTFLGIIIDTVKGELRLPLDKLTRLTDLLTAWQARRSCTRKKLESLIGLLEPCLQSHKAGSPISQVHD